MKNALHYVHVNIRKIDRNGSEVRGRESPAPRGGKVVSDGTVDDACFGGGNFDALPQRGAFVGVQRKRLQTFDQAQIADSGKIQTDVGQGV